MLEAKIGLKKMRQSAVNKKLQDYFNELPKALESETMKILRIVCLFVLTAILLTGCLATVPNLDAQHSGSVQTKQYISAGIQPPKIDTDGHLLTPWIRSTMLSAFYQRAAHLGLKIDPNGTPVVIHIAGVRSRSEDARILFNFFDGADYLSATVDVGDASFHVGEDTWLYWVVTNFRTIDSVSIAVGTQAANGIALIAGLPIDD